jgi:transposase
MGGQLKTRVWVVSRGLVTCDDPPKVVHEFSVVACGLVLGRDHNAALNILRLGESLAERQNCIQECI